MSFFSCYIWAFEDTEDEKKDGDLENDDVDIEIL